MKGIIRRSNYSITVIITAVLFCVTTVLISPLILKAESGTPADRSKESKVDRTEAKIKEYHSSLKITDAQEAEWNKVAQVMRENAAKMEALIKERREKANTLNAVEDLKAYSRISDAHADGLRNFIAAFEPLYNSMSADQKKNADRIFTEHGQRKGPKKK